MGKRRSMLRKRKYVDACSMITVNGDVAPWSNLSHDVLSLVMMKLGVFDFLTFSRVCKSWRSLTVCNRKKFMASRAPMSVCIYTNNKVIECYLEDIEGRNYITTLPHSIGRHCVGLTCGYLILFSEKRKDFWLVNPITWHELHIPSVPLDDRYVLHSLVGILVFLPSIYEWVFVVYTRFYYNEFWFCIVGKPEWTKLSTPFHIDDLFAFKGKIYAHDLDSFFYEVMLYPTPNLTFIEIKNYPVLDFYFPVLGNWNRNLYGMDLFPQHTYKIKEINLSKKECVACEKRGEEFAVFMSSSKHVAAIVQTQLWANIHLQYRRCDVRDLSGKGGYFFAEMWYFFHECLNVKL